MKKHLKGLYHQRKIERSEAEAEWKDQIFVKKVAPAKLKKGAEAIIDGNMKVSISQIDRR